MKGEEIVRHCDRHNNETVTLRKHVTKSENMLKWMLEFLRKFENCAIKIYRVNSILIAKSINLQLFTLILYGVGGRCDVDNFKLTASAQSIYRKVYYLFNRYVRNIFWRPGMSSDALACLLTPRHVFWRLACLLTPGMSSDAWHVFWRLACYIRCYV